MNILEEAIEAAAESLNKGLFTLSDNHYAIRFDNPIEYRKLHQEAELEFAEFALEAALPHLEAALRKQIATDIRAEISARYGDPGMPYWGEFAASVAEEGTTK